MRPSRLGRASDAERLAAWVNDREVTLVSLDLMTYSDPSFCRAVAGLARFDQLTDQRVQYLVDGVAATQRISILYLATAPERMTISSATMAPPPAKLGGATTFRARVAAMRNRCEQAKTAASAAEASSVDEFVSQTLGTWQLDQLDASAA